MNWLVIQEEKLGEVGVRMDYIISHRTEQVNGAGLRELVLLVVTGREYRTRHKVRELLEKIAAR